MLGAVVATASMLQMGAASATPVRAAQTVTPHQGARVCGPHNCVYAYVDADADATTVDASATVKVVDLPSPVARLQVDDVVVTAFGTPVAQAGPRNLGNAQPVTQTASAPITGSACQMLRVTAHVSARLSNGSLISGQVTSLPFTSTYAGCPSLPDQVEPYQIDCVGHPEGGREDCTSFAMSVVLSRDGTHVFGVAELDSRGPDFLRVSIDSVRLTSYLPRPLSSSAAQQVNSGNLPSNQDVRTVDYTQGVVVEPGCRDYSVTMSFASRVYDGRLSQHTEQATVNNICA